MGKAEQTRRTRYASPNHRQYEKKRLARLRRQLERQLSFVLLKGETPENDNVGQIRELIEGWAD